ncbi:hypothetical protein V7S43_009656 [Phytophthora oleae]|uniref:Ankyrin repeat-containing domain n=1 Tax=Phytophthora oleae TaxID=2107226 RepID=A0ABD3FGS9_9STRA
MDYTASRGHLDVVKWLHANRSESCATAAMNEAAQSNNVAVMEWLDQNRMEGFTSGAMALVLINGQLEAFQWLLSRGAKLCVATEMKAAAAFGNFCILWVLYQKNCGSIETLKNALIRSCRRLEFAEWAYVYHRHEFEQNIAEQLFAD